MTDELIAILEQLNQTVLLQGSIDPSQGYPDSFFTIWNNDSPDHAHYDNQPYGTAWDFNIYYYSTDPTDVYETIEAARTALMAAGWIVPSKGFSAMSDVTTHTGRGLHIYKLDT